MGGIHRPFRRGKATGEEDDEEEWEGEMPELHHGWGKRAGDKKEWERLIELADGTRSAKEIASILNKEYRTSHSTGAVRKKAEREGGSLKKESAIGPGSRWKTNYGESTEVDYLRSLNTAKLTLEEIRDDLNQTFNTHRPPRSKESVRLKLYEEKLPYVRKGTFIQQYDKIRGEENESLRLIVERDRKIRELQADLNEVRRKYAQALTKETVAEKICDQMRGFVDALPPAPRAAKPKPSRKTTIEEPHLLLSDWHLDERVSPAATLGFGGYDFATFKARLKLLEITTIDLCENKLQGYTFPKLHVSMLGDFITGIIHDELRETSELDVTSATIGGAFVFAQFFRNLAQSFNEIHVRCVVGNHGRFTKKPRYKLPQTNFDYIFYNLLSIFLINQPGITFDIPLSFFLLDDINEHTWLLMHGDAIRSWAGFPFYGLERMVSRLQELIASRGNYIDYVALGHFHQLALLNTVRGKKIVNGSGIGPTEFSVKSVQSATAPFQLLHGSHYKYGFTWSFPIMLEHADPALAKEYSYEPEEEIAKQLSKLTNEE